MYKIGWNHERFIFLSKNLASLFLSVLGLGYLPFAPGTFGSVPGIFLCYIWSHHGYVLIILSVLSYFLIKKGQYTEDDQDPQWIVIDELIGMGVACWVYFQYYECYHWLGWLLLLFFFRVFDILKPFPICWIESKATSMNAPFGIIIDDVVAGVFAALSVIFVMPPFVLG